ncbi:APC family permease [Mumia sp. zg.B53]|uniref:APC family permease n=1 Tax=unclassified Mumia TaxID=2621872 RepID=UPI001C6F0B39|nr:MULTISPECIES: APC family permease [unclassified Mumia]MBW9205275.1 APC family permease [Mumia sp. zg.B17]MBW9208726.1 APC family permease [Mumia sp. zg.B21]MBW9213337.1 APC family permease [Mumia sp. zg.B53]MDD9349170.1 APC family permease [Mumia sp.]
MAELGKRMFLGRKLRSTQLDETLLPKRIALPVFASDALSSVAYAPDEIFLVLSMGGLSAYAFNWKIGLAVAVVMLTVVASYRQNVRAYPSGGGDYEVATVNLGPRAGVTVASALMVDYVLTVAVSISSGVQNATAALPWLNGHEALAASVLVLLLIAVNLRGLRESGAAFAIPSYLFMASIIGMALWGFARYALGDLPKVASADLELAAEEPYLGAVSAVAMTFLVARAFSSGCAALTGVEAISNGVPAFRRPKSKNAATTLALLGVISVTMLMSIVVLADLTHLRFAEDPATQLTRDGVPVGDSYVQDTVIGQLAAAVYDNAQPLFYLTVATTGIILVLAANTAFNGFPVLGSVLARDGHLPRQLDTRGDRLSFSNGIVLLGLAAIVLILAFDAQVTRLIQLYIVGVFVSFTLSQLGMLRHWGRHLRTETDPAERRRMKRSRSVNMFGLAMTATVLVIVLVTKFFAGAWIAISAMVVLYVLMRGIRRHYDEVADELAIEESDVTLPSRVHAIVLVGRLHKPVMRALAYARVSRPDALEAITVDLDPAATTRLTEQWDALDIPVPLVVIGSPYRELVRPVIKYVKELRRASPRDIVMVYVPEYVVGRWYEQILHNQTALRLKSRLLFTPGVVVTSVPYLLQSAKQRGPERVRPVPGEVRQGRTFNERRKP